MSFIPNSLAERFAMRSNFWRLLARSAQDLENRPEQASGVGPDPYRAIRELARAHLVEAFVADHGYRPAALQREMPWFPAETAPENSQHLVWVHDSDVPWLYDLRMIASWNQDQDGLMSWYDVFGEPIPTPWLWTPLVQLPPKPPGWVAGAGKRPRLRPISREAREALHAL